MLYVFNNFVQITTAFKSMKEGKALKELKQVLEDLKNPQKEAGETVDGFEKDVYDTSPFVFDIDNKSKINTKPPSSIFTYIGKLAKHDIPNILKTLHFAEAFFENEEPVTDDESLYETSNSKTETIYRCPSLDDISVTGHTGYMNNDNLVEEDEDVNISHVSSSVFYMEDFSDTFNIDSEDEINEEAKNKQKYEFQNKLIETKSQLEKGVVKSVNSSEQNKVIENTRNGSKFDTDKNDSSGSSNLQISSVNSTYSSMSSNGSVKFNDIILGDILHDLENIEDLEPSPDRKMLNFDTSSMEENLNIEESKIVSEIVARLKRELEPKLEKLTEESQKYELAKKIYKLPSLSNLNEEIKLKHLKIPHGKKFNLEFDNSVIENMVKEKKKTIEPAKKEGSSKNHNKRTPGIISAQQQLKLDFNKYRNLETISEEHERTLSLESNEPKKDQSTTMKCMQSGYTKAKDFRSVSKIGTDELICLLQFVQNGKMKELSRVETLKTMFETGAEWDNVNKLSNLELRNSILVELGRRKVI